MGGPAPKPDPAIGAAAAQSAQTGADMLEWMKSQAAITNQWAQEDRDRYKTVFEPLQDQFIADAQNWDTPERRQARANQAIADVSQQGALQQKARERRAMAMGVNPASGRFAAESAKEGTTLALAKAGAANLANRAVEQEGYARRADAINMGRGLAVNPATSMGISNGAVSTGGNAAMRGYGQQANLLNMQYGQQMDAYNTQQGTIGAIAGAAGRALGSGAFLSLLSSKGAKKDKAKAKGALRAVENIPVEEWTYKEGAGDGGRHIGPYAEDFKRETGKGDGKTIPVIDAIGLTMGAVKELSAKVDRMAGPKGLREAS